MKKTTLILFLFIAMATRAQTFEWVKTPPITFNSNPDMIGYATTCDPSGNIYTMGFKENTFLYSEIFGDLFYNKYDNTGQLQFSKTFTGHATIYNAVADSQGNILVAAGYVNIMTVGDLALNTVDQGVQALLLKFDPDGNLLWHQHMTIEESFDCRFQAIALDASDNIYVGIYDFMNSYIKKLSPDGDLISTITQSDARSVMSLSVDNAGNIYAAGSCADPGATFAGVSANPPFNYNTFLVKYSPSGVFQWIKYVDDITCPEPHVVAVSPNEVYFSSYLFGDYLFDNIQSEGPYTMFSDVFITKLNADGAYQWVREVPGAGFLHPASRRSLFADADANLYFAGSTRGNISWNGQFSTSANGNSNDAIILKFNPDGDLVMAKTAGGEGHDRIDAIALNQTGDIFIAGMSRGSASFDGFAYTATDQYESWSYLAKLTQSALSTDESQSQAISLYPNPSSDYIRIANATQTFSGSIVNMLGQNVKDFALDNDHPIDVRTLSKGTYLVKLNNSKTVKFIKN